MSGPEPQSPSRPERAANETASVVLGEFAVAGTSHRWLVWWDDTTGTVIADTMLRRRPGCVLGAPQVLAQLPNLAYARRTLAAVDAAHGGPHWRESRGIQPLVCWFSMVTAGLNRDVWRWYQADDTERHAHYIDGGHTRRDADAVFHDHEALELWHELDDFVRHARSVIDRLTSELAPHGNLAAAATLAQELSETAVSIDIALTEAYRIVHHASPIS